MSIGMGCYFGGKGFYRLGFWPINVGFTMSKGLLVHLREFSVRDLVCVIPVRLVPNSNRHLSRKKKRYV